MTTTDTFIPEQVRERGLQVAMKASERLSKALDSPAPNAEMIDALAGAVIAGNGMVSVALLEIPEGT